MDILSLPVGVDQPLVPGHVGQHPQFDLGIIRVHKGVALLRHKDLADLPPQLHAHRNVLKVWFCAADAACGCDSLVKLAMDPAVLPNKPVQPLRISGIQFGQLPVIQDLADNRVIRGQLFQHVSRRRIPGLGLLPVRQLHLLKQNLPQLLGRINIKFHTRQLMDLLFQGIDLHL